MNFRDTSFAMFSWSMDWQEGSLAGNLTLFNIFRTAKYLPYFHDTNSVNQLEGIMIPSGKRSHNYGKSPCFLVNSTISMAINVHKRQFSTVKPVSQRVNLIEYHKIPPNHHFPIVFLWFSYGFPSFCQSLDRKSRTRWPGPGAGHLSREFLAWNGAR